MVSVCWIDSNIEGFVKFVKYVELAAGNMLAITNLAICVNLALIITVSETNPFNAQISTKSAEACLVCEP